MDPLSSTSDPARAVYVISVAAELAGVHAQTLRIYERKGLVEPARTPGVVAGIAISTSLFCVEYKNLPTRG